MTDLFDNSNLEQDLDIQIHPQNAKTEEIDAILDQKQEQKCKNIDNQQKQQEINNIQQQQVQQQQQLKQDQYEKQVTQDSNIPDKQIEKQQFTHSYFKQIIDVSDQLAQGNMIPALISLKENYQSVNQTDQYGFTLLHHSATNNFRDIAIFLLKNKADVNFRNAQQQTPLMMACNYGWMELVKLFIDYGANINIRDQFNFSPLMYALKSNSHAIFYYLIALGAEKNDFDGNRSGVSHWGAYNNNVFLLKFLKNIQADLEFKDNEGQNPLQRAISNKSYESIKFLVHNFPESIPEKYVQNHKLILEETHSQSIHKIISEVILQKHKSSHYKAYQEQIRENIQFLTYFFYVLMSLLLGVVFAYSNHHASDSSQPTSFISFNFVLYIMVLYLLGFVYFFIFNVQSEYGKGRYLIADDLIKRKEKMKELQQNKMQSYLQSLNLNDFKHINFSHINKLLSNLNLASQQQNQYIDTEAINDHLDPEEQLQDHLKPQNLNFIQEIQILFEAGKFKDLKSYDYNRVCSTCTRYQEESTIHCPVCDTCVPNFSHHSFFFNKCIHIQNYAFYLFILMVQQCTLFMFLILIIRNHWGYVSGNPYTILFETVYYMYHKENWFNALLYLISIFLFVMNSYEFTIEAYGMCNNMTRHEIFNSHKYRYLHEAIVNQKGQIILKLKGLQNPKVKLTQLILHLKMK